MKPPAGLLPDAGLDLPPRTGSDAGSTNASLCSVFLSPSLLPTSCWPTSCRVLSADGKFIVIVASRDLPAGEELSRASDVRLDASLQSEIQALQDELATAEKRLEADPYSLKHWLTVAESITRSMDILLEGTCKTQGSRSDLDAHAFQQRSAFIDMEVCIAQRLIALATQGSLAGDPDICGRAANSCTRAADAFSAREPLSHYRVYFRHMALDAKLVLQKALRKSNTREDQAAAAELAVAWCSRHGCVLN